MVKNKKRIIKVVRITFDMPMVKFKKLQAYAEDNDVEPMDLITGTIDLMMVGIEKGVPGITGEISANRYIK